MPEPYDKDIIFRSLEKAADTHGDITPLVYESLFRTHPEAEELFLVKGDAFKTALQDKMVQDAIFSFMEYLEIPEEIEIEFKYTIPQHLDLGIPVKYFNALLCSVAEVVCDAMPAGELELTSTHWSRLTGKLTAIASQHAAKAI